MVDILHRVGIKAPIAKVYAALATPEGVAGWWTKEVAGVSRPRSTFNVAFHTLEGAEVGTMEIEVLELVPDMAVRWRFKAGPKEWVGTDVTFELSQAGEFTVLLFGHRNWREPGEFMSHCTTKWGTFLVSLRDLVETGNGRPAPHDLSIGDWH